MNERKRIEAAGKILNLRNELGTLISKIEASGEQERYLLDIYDSFGSWDKIAGVFNVEKEDMIEEAIKSSQGDDLEGS